MRFSGFGRSEVGHVRHDNEDSGFVGPSCLVVADGVGGAAAGEVASATTAYVVSASALAAPGADPREVVQGATWPSSSCSTASGRRPSGPAWPPR